MILLATPAIAHSTQPKPIKALPYKAPVILLKGQQPPKGVDLINLQALLEGKLVVINRCLYVQSKNNNSLREFKNILVTWRWNDSWVKKGSKVEISVTNQSKSATVGEFNRFGGGYSNTSMEYLHNCKIFNKQMFSVHSIEPKKSPNKTREILQKLIKKGL
jgi:hypothetical protein